MTLYTTILYTHSGLRWIVLLSALAVCVRSGLGWWRELPWTNLQTGLHKACIHAADLQMTLGLLLYLWLSPWSRAFFHNPSVGFRDSSLRFFGVEHIVGMLIAITLLHFGQERPQRVAAALDKQRLAFLYSLAALLLMAASVPWPFMPYPRPWLRGL